MVYEIRDSRPLMPLFGPWEETMLYSCFQGVMGKLYADSSLAPRWALAELGDFAFLAGAPCEEAVRHPLFSRAFCILTPQSEAWSQAIETVWDRQARAVWRYATRKDPDAFDPGVLLQAENSLPAGFTLREMDESLYHACRSALWSRDLVGQFPDWESFSRLGLGVAVLTPDGSLAAGAGTYSRYMEGIEIEIDTRPDLRRRGLAMACGARLIRLCLRSGLYPSWDAQNPGSLALSEKLGYTFSHRYRAYEVTAE